MATAVVEAIGIHGPERLDRAIATLSRVLDASRSRDNDGRAQADHGLGQTEGDVAMLARAVVRRTEPMMPAPARRVDNDEPSRWRHDYTHDRNRYVGRGR